jgi:hypothetical protein
MKRPMTIAGILMALLAVTGAVFLRYQSGRERTSQSDAAADTVTTKSAPAISSIAPNRARVIHVLVALCDNQYQGIVPVPARIGNGDDPENNLYWGAAFGIKTFFGKSADWSLAARIANPTPQILDRCIFNHKTQSVFLIADAYRGREIKQCAQDFLEYAAAKRVEPLQAGATEISGGAAADLIVYVGHNGLMDFELTQYPDGPAENSRDAIILACASKQYFEGPLRRTGARPLLWTTGLMAPEAYILKAAVDGWIRNEAGESIRARAARAYNTYQKCGMAGATRLFATGL